jgi:HSP20 family protein
MSDTQVTQRDESAANGAVNRNGAREQERRATVTPPVDIVEDSKAVTLWADLPGVSKDKLDIRVHDGSLTIEGESAVPAASNVRLSHAEVRAPYFARRFTISDDFDTSKIEANLKDGVLKLVIPRREQAQPRRIEVNVG